MPDILKLMYASLGQIVVHRMVSKGLIKYIIIITSHTLFLAFVILFVTMYTLHLL